MPVKRKASKRKAPKRRAAPKRKTTKRKTTKRVKAHKKVRSSCTKCKRKHSKKSHSYHGVGSYDRTH